MDWKELNEIKARLEKALDWEERVHESLLPEQSQLKSRIITQDVPRLIAVIENEFMAGGPS